MKERRREDREGGRVKVSAVSLTHLESQKKQALGMSVGIVKVVLTEVGRPTLNLGSAVTWTWVLSCGERSEKEGIHFALLPDNGCRRTTCLIFPPARLPGHGALHP